MLALTIISREDVHILHILQFRLLHRRKREARSPRRKNITLKTKIGDNDHDLKIMTHDDADHHDISTMTRAMTRTMTRTMTRAMTTLPQLGRGRSWRVGWGGSRCHNPTQSAEKSSRCHNPRQTAAIMMKCFIAI